MIKEAEAERIALERRTITKPVSRKGREAVPAAVETDPGPATRSAFRETARLKSLRETIGADATRSDGTTAGIEVTNRDGTARDGGVSGGSAVETVPGENGPPRNRGDSPGGPFVGSATDAREDDDVS